MIFLFKYLIKTLKKCNLKTYFLQKKDMAESRTKFCTFIQFWPWVAKTGYNANPVSATIPTVNVK